MNKNIIYILVVILILIGAFLFTNKTEPVLAPIEENTEVESITTEEEKEVPLQEETQDEPKEETPKAAGFIMSQVALHNTEADCWSAINGSVYNLTSWIASHPGGAKAIIGLCGKDGSDAFNGQHGGKAPQENQLAKFKIGILIN